MEMASSKLTIPLLILVGVVTLLFGLWPLNFFPENRVRWLSQQDGIQFYKQGLSSRRASGGVIYGDSPFDIRTKTHAFEPATIEIYLEPHEKRGGRAAHIVSFYDGYPRSPLVIGQWKSNLVIRSRDNENEARDTYREIDLERGMNPNEKKLITIASGPDRTEIYVNGEPARSYDIRALIGVENFCGHLNLGNSPVGHHGWVGNLYGLALYDKLLTSEQIQQHHMLWANKPEDMSAAGDPEPLILYTFTEQAGDSVLNRAGDTNHLHIPPAFKPLRSSVLIRFWRDIGWNMGTATDILVNVLGFVPFGYCLLVYLIGHRHMLSRQAAFLTVLAGATLSLIIESSQMGLPTRTPSSLDFLCNTVGAALAVIVFRAIEKKRSPRTPGAPAN